MKGYHDSKTNESIRDLWQTPKFFFDYYDLRFNFEFDVAASESNTLCNCFYNEKHDALSDNCSWDGPNWCNPPFSNPLPWIEKAIGEMKSGKLTVMLLPADTSVKWFKLAFDNCSECHFISGRLAFINAETKKPVSGNNKGSVVFIFDPHSPFKSLTTLIDRESMK